MKRKIDLNADLGEDESTAGIARDSAMMKIISSCNIACGGHAGSLAVMEAMLVAATENGVSAGAHPSYPDRENFGRISLHLSAEQLRHSLSQQINLLSDQARKLGVTLKHIKPHGALYNDAQDDPQLADILVDLAQEFALPLVSMPGSIVEKRAREKQLAFVGEAFIDRQYREDARLVPRSETGAVLAHESERVIQGLALAKRHAIRSKNGKMLTIPADTLCLHSDSDGALETARAMRDALESADIVIAATH